MRVAVLALGLLWAATGMAAEESAADRERARDDEIAALKQQLGVVVGELEKLRTEMGVPEDEVLESKYGFGPAAAQVYKLGRGTRIGGYAEGFYRNQIGDAAGDGTDTADMLRAVLYVGHKFTDKLVWNSEIEFEHATTGGANPGSVSVEFAALDYLMRDELALRGGLLLVPMGFLNEIHEPPFFYGVSRPEVESVIIPSTWRENGVGIFGRIGESLEYRLYTVNGLRASGFTSAGLRGGRQNGNRVAADDLAAVARVDLTPMPGLLVGGAFYRGNSGQDQTGPAVAGSIDLPSAATTIWELHGQYQAGGLHLRALFAQAEVGSAGRLSQALGLATGTPVAERMLGGYGEVAYDILPLVIPGTELAFEPFVRFEYVDTQHDVPTGFTQDGANRRRIWVPGVSFRPHPNVVLKLDYRNIDPLSGEAADELNLGFGVAF
jgi:hypothetical protein